VRETQRFLREFKGENIKIFVGGTIPKEDNEALREAGASGIFNASQRIDEVLAEIDTLLSAPA
jgi:methylmalonyl-CoA mutase cobalamin-binding domain/chain